MSVEDWREIIDINLTGTVLMCRAVLPLMTVRGWGRIVNIGSASVNEGVAGQTHHVSAQAGVSGLTGTPELAGAPVVKRRGRVG